MMIPKKTNYVKTKNGNMYTISCDATLGVVTHNVSMTFPNRYASKSMLGWKAFRVFKPEGWVLPE